MGPSLRARVRRHVVDVDLEVDLAAAPVTVLFGPSGAGKTTLLRCVAGLDQPEPGSVITFGDRCWFDGRTRVPARSRRIGFLFQDHVLFPHLSVVGNVGYGLHEGSRAERAVRVHEALERAGAAHLVDTPVRHLSGGEAQRVALARALAPGPELMLLDEPLAALDVPTRTRLRGELRRVLRSTGVPALVVTHDRAEALALGDRVAVLIEGRLRQHDRVEEVFSRPADGEVAATVDTETTVEGRVLGVDRGVTRVRVGDVVLAATSHESLAPGTRVLVCIRAEGVALSLADGASADSRETSPRNHLPAVVTDVVDHGPLLRIDLDAGFALAAYVTRPTLEELRLAPGSPVVAVMKAPAVHLVRRS